MFPHSITIFTLNSDESWDKTFIEGVYWEGKNQIVQNGKGVDNVSNINVYIPFGKDIGKLGRGSYVIKGKHDGEIKSSRDFEGIKDCIIVQTDIDHDAGSALDHYHIVGV